MPKSFLKPATALLAGLVVMTLAGCATSPAAQTSTERPSAKFKPTGFVVAQDTVEASKGDQGDVYTRVQYGYNYDTRRVELRKLNDDGTLREALPLPNYTLTALASEMEYAYALLRESDQLGPIVNRPDAEFQGGFAYREPNDKVCHLNADSRCVYVIVFGGKDRSQRIALSIVDIANGAIVHPFFGTEPPTGAPQAPIYH
jgi:hypothetical protein